MDYYEFSIQNGSVSGHVQKLQITITLTGNLNDEVVLIKHYAMKYGEMEV